MDRSSRASSSRSASCSRSMSSRCPGRSTRNTSASTSTACRITRSQATSARRRSISRSTPLSSASQSQGSTGSCARVRERWVWWAMGATAIFILFVIMVTPVFVAPLFNDYKPLPEGETRESILALARDDAGSGRRRLLVRRLAADEAHQRERLGTLGHDTHLAERQSPERHVAAGDPRRHGPRDGSLPPAPRPVAHARIHALVRHRVLGHQPQLRPIPAAHGERWGVRDLADPAGLPLAFAIFTIVLLVLTPFTNYDDLAWSRRRRTHWTRCSEGAARIRECRDAAQHVSQARAGAA